MRKRTRLGEPERFKLSPVYTASSWPTVIDAVFTAADKGRGSAVDVDGSTVVPRLTNREAVALIQAWRAEANMTARNWPLWDQFAAIAYGWDPSTDTLVFTDAQADALYPDDIAVELWKALQEVAADLARERSDVPPRIELDADTFDDATMRGDVLRALDSDGSKASANSLRDIVDNVRKVRPFPDGGKKVDDAIDVITFGPQRRRINGILLIAAIAVVVIAAMDKKSSRRRR